MKSKKIIVLCVVLLIILLLFGVVIWSFYKKVSKNIITTNSVDFKTRNKEADTFKYRQKPIIDFYNSLELDRQTKVKIFYELLGPLGGLDPIASPSAFSDIHATVNYLYGVNFKAFNFPDDEVLYSVTAPIRREQEFNSKEFLNKNENILSIFSGIFNNNPELNTLSIGYSSNYKINNYFGDDIRNYYWEVYQKSNTDPYYSYRVLTKNNKDVVDLRKKYDSLFKVLSALKIQTVYKCEGKVIYIVDGLADNAFGYIYNAKTSKDVNCGMLKRFRIKKDIPLNEKWRFWFAS